MTKKEFKKHLYEAALSFPATLKAETLCRRLAVALADANKLLDYCNITGNVKAIEETWSELDQRLENLVVVVNSLCRDISAAIQMAAGGRTQQIVSKTQLPKRAAR